MTNPVQYYFPRSSQIGGNKNVLIILYHTGVRDKICRHPYMHNYMYVFIYIYIYIYIYMYNIFTLIISSGTEKIWLVYTDCL